MAKKVVIVGAGIAGLSLAYWLKEDSSLEVQILDQGQEFAASNKSAGFLTSGSLSFYQHLIHEFGEDKANKLWKFAKANISEVIKFIKDNEIHTELIQGGSYSLLEKEAPVLPFEVTKKNPIKGFENYHCYFDETEASLNPLLFVNKLTSIVKARGVSFVNAKINQNLIRSYPADHYFICTNNSDIFPTEITRHRAQACSFKTSNILSHSNFYLPSKKIYFRFSENELIIGGLRILDPLTEQTNQLGLNEKIQTELERFVIDHIDSSAELINQWSGIMGFSSTGLPQYKEHQDFPMSFIGGFSGHGNGFAFLLSKLVAHKYLSNQSPIEVELFRA